MFKIRCPPFIILSLAALTLLLAALYFYVFAGLPDVDSMPAHLASGSLHVTSPSIRIVDRYGRTLYEVIDDSGGRNLVVPLQSVPLRMRQAVIAVEDRSFYTNPGVDLRGILRSVWINLRGGETLAGGSTITQQVARNLLLDESERYDRTLRRKLRESALALALSNRLSKDDILALYLNQTYYGGLAYGVEAASQTFFSKPVSELDLAEAALIAGLPQSPALYNPLTDPDSARARQATVLGLMERAKFISAQERRSAEREPLVFASVPYPMEAPHFVFMVRAELDSLFPDLRSLAETHGGMSVRTGLDLDWQHEAERAVRRQIETLRRSGGGLGHNLNNAALVALDPQTGEIRALVGSPDYNDELHSGAINMALAPRQPGSALKPLIYAAALDPQRSDAWSAATTLLDVRTSFLTHEGLAYVPSNYDLREHGPVSVRQALASSLNIPAVKTLEHVGLEALFDLSARLGITTFGDPDRYDLSLALGGGEVRLLQLTAAYAAFANGGFRLDPLSILEVSGSDGEILYSADQARGARVLDERVAWLISDILSDDQARSLGFGANSVLRLDRPAAVKTGTTTNFHDNWTIGYTPSLVVGVWAGNAGYEPMREVNGLTGAAPIWHAFLRTVLAGRPPENFNRPDGVLQTEVCVLSGLLPTPACPFRRWEWFLPGTQPQQPDHFYRFMDLDLDTGLPAGEGVPPDRRVRKLFLDLPPEAHPWARSEGLPLVEDSLHASYSGTSLSVESASNPLPLSTGPGERDMKTETLSSPALKIISPADGSIYLLASNMPLASQTIRLAAVGEGLQSVTLFLDGQPASVLKVPPYEFWWQLSPGVHELWAEATTRRGEHLLSERITFEVRVPED